MSHANCLSLLQQAADEAAHEPYRVRILELRRALKEEEDCRVYWESDAAPRYRARDQEAAKQHYDHILATGWAPTAGGAGGPGGYRPVRKLRNKNTSEVVYVNAIDAKEYLGHETHGQDWEDVTE